MADTIEQALTNARNICKTSGVIATIFLSANRLRTWNFDLWDSRWVLSHRIQQWTHVRGWQPLKMHRSRRDYWALSRALSDTAVKQSELHICAGAGLTKWEWIHSVTWCFKYTGCFPCCQGNWRAAAKKFTHLRVPGVWPLWWVTHSKAVFTFGLYYDRITRNFNLKVVAGLKATWIYLKYYWKRNA